MLLEVRNNINESLTNASHWSNLEILNKLNIAQRNLAQILATSSGDWLVSSKTVSISNGSAALDLNIAKPLYVEHATEGYEIPIKNVRDRQLTRQPSLSVFAGGIPDCYFLQGYIHINKSDFSDDVVVYYENRVPDLLVGQAGSGSGASALVLDSTFYPKPIDDYYNYVVVEIHNSGGIIRSSISDYTASTLTAVITGTPTENDWYGSETLLPYEAEAVMVLKATVMALSKPSSAIDPKYYEMFKDEYAELYSTFTQWIADRYSGSHHVRITEVD
jgi:hypothetical protein